MGLEAESAATNRCEALKDKDRRLKMAILWKQNHSEKSASL